MKPYTRVADGIRLSVRVVPNAAADRIDGLHAAADGKVSLKLRVRAQPEKGKANAAVIKLLAKALGLAKADITLTSGSKDRNKAFLLAGAPEALSGKVDAVAQT